MIPGQQLLVRAKIVKEGNSEQSEFLFLFFFYNKYSDLMGFFSLKRMLLIVFLANLLLGYYFYLFDKFEFSFFSLLFGFAVLLFVLEKISPYIALIAVLGNLFAFFEGMLLYSTELLMIFLSLFLFFETILFYKVFAFKLKHFLFVSAFFAGVIFVVNYLAISSILSFGEIVRFVLAVVFFCLVLPFIVSIIFSNKEF